MVPKKRAIGILGVITVVLLASLVSASRSSPRDEEYRQNQMRVRTIEEDSSGGFSCPLCSTTQCKATQCDLAAPYACLAGSATGGCSSSPSTWSNPAVCETCCSVVGCEISCPSCGPLVCQETPIPCGEAAPYLCLAGSSAGQCGLNTTWVDTPTCGSCCNLLSCFTSKPTPNPAAPPTPANSTCKMCPKEMCKNPPCGRAAPYYCFTNGGCGTNTTWTNNPACHECCDLNICYPPRPPNPWDIVPNSTNCTLHPKGPVLAPDPKATPWGGIDVSAYGCRADVSKSCCGVTPRFNWVLSTCHTNASKRVSMACTHEGAANSELKLYYLSAYQFNGTAWVKDPTSSLRPTGNDPLVNFTDYFVGGGYRQDWDIKYATTTNKTATQGLGPPGMMWVISAQKFSWSAFYALNQITVNRGPGGEVLAINCWGDSSGELDFIESPFWADVKIPLDRLYLTVTADAGRCFPVQKNIPAEFHQDCTNPYCCEMCSCPNGTVCFGDPADIGYTAMGCIPIANMSQIPNGSTIFEANKDPLACGKYFGGVSGGSTSDAYFTQFNNAGDGEVIYAAVVDRAGVRVFRWPANGSPGGEDYDPLIPPKSGDRERLPRDDDPEGFIDAWPGIGRYGSRDVLTELQPKMHLFKKHPPCTDWNTPCMLFEPSCTGDCPLISAAGNFGPDELAGGYSAEAARDGLNWWDLFVPIINDTDMAISDLPKWEYVKTFVPPLPFYCNQSCSIAVCHSPTRCPTSLKYMCTKGDGVNGCNSDPSFWPLSQHCEDCCDVTLCEHPCSSCSETICDLHLCTTAAPYICTAGPEAKGCNANASWWPEQGQCYSCCDTRTCSSGSASSSSSGQGGLTSIIEHVEPVKAIADVIEDVQVLAEDVAASVLKEEPHQMQRQPALHRTLQHRTNVKIDREDAGVPSLVSENEPQSRLSTDEEYTYDSFGFFNTNSALFAFALTVATVAFLVLLSYVCRQCMASLGGSSAKPTAKGCAVPNAESP